MRVIIMAARSTPRSESANSQAFLPRAKPRRARSAALLARQILPSSAKRAKSPHRFQRVVDRLCTSDERDNLGRCSRSHASRATSRGALCSLRTCNRSSALRPLISRSISNRASMRLTDSKAIGEIAVAVRPRRAFFAISASSKNCLRACAQRRAKHDLRCSFRPRSGFLHLEPHDPGLRKGISLRGHAHAAQA